MQYTLPSESAAVNASGDDGARVNPTNDFPRLKATKGASQVAATTV